MFWMVVIPSFVKMRCCRKSKSGWPETFCTTMPMIT
jgi:hypothetical protein